MTEQKVKEIISNELEKRRPKKAVFTLWLPNDLRKRFKEYCVRKDKGMSSLLRDMIRLAIGEKAEET